MTDQEKIDVIQGQMDGKVIELQNTFGSWMSSPEGCDFNFSAYVYRIKPEPEYIEIDISEAFALLAKGGEVRCQVCDNGSSWGNQIELVGANKHGSQFHVSTGYKWAHCRVTKEVYNA